MTSTTGFCIVAPLSSLKKLDALKWTSAISILFVFFIAAVVFFYALDLPALDPCKSDNDNDDDDDDGECVGDRVAATLTLDTVRVFGIFIFAFTCQTVRS
jgi:amino acid permease